MTKNTKSLFAAVAIAAALAAPVSMALAPASALANDGYAPRAAATAAKAAHYEGEKGTIGDDWGQPVYAEWHKGASGKWWATFWTYNYTKVWAEPVPAGCGWSFHVYDKDGNFINVYRCEESSTYGLYGPQGVSSHWSNNDATQWF